jgi:hypothetical protein
VENCGGRGGADDGHGIGAGQFRAGQRLKPQSFRKPNGTAEAVPYKDLAVAKRGAKAQVSLALNVAADAAIHKDSKVFIQALQTES